MTLDEELKMAREKGWSVYTADFWFDAGRCWVVHDGDASGRHIAQRNGKWWITNRSQMEFPGTPDHPNHKHLHGEYDTLAGAMVGYRFAPHETYWSQTKRT